MFDFEKDYVLENDVVRLAPLTFSDYDHLLHFSINEPNLWDFSLNQANTPEKLKLYIEKAINDRSNRSSYAFSVFDKRVNKFAGSTRYYDIQMANASLQIGFTWYGKDFQGTGINKNCKFLLLDFAFDVFNMERVEFRADANNHRSINAMKRIGCVVEGILRSHTTKPNGDRRDSIILSILKDEWYDRVKESVFYRQQ
jgi:N-acetyltransferase